MDAIIFLESKDKMCTYYLNKGSCSENGCPLYDNTWDCNHYCFSYPKSAVRVVEAFLAKGLV